MRGNDRSHKSLCPGEGYLSRQGLNRIGLKDRDLADEYDLLFFLQEFEVPAVAEPSQSANFAAEPQI